MNSIQALLEALKRTKGGLPGEDDDDGGQPIAAKVSVLKAKPIGKLDMSDPDADDDSDASPLGDSDHDMMDMDQDKDQDNSDQSQQDAEIVDVLQDQYPEIYAKIVKQIGQPSDDGGDLSDTTDLANLMG